MQSLFIIVGEFRGQCPYFSPELRFHSRVYLFVGALESIFSLEISLRKISYS